MLAIPSIPGRTGARPRYLPASCTSTSAHARPTYARHISPPSHHCMTTSARPAIARQGRVPVPWFLPSHVRFTSARAPYEPLPQHENEHEHEHQRPCPPPTPMKHERKCSLLHSPPSRCCTTTSARPAIAHQGRAPLPCFLPPHVCCTSARAPHCPLPQHEHERACPPPTPMTHERECSLPCSRHAHTSPHASRVHSRSARHLYPLFHYRTSTSARPAIAR